MIDFEKELKNYKEKKLISEVEDDIKDQDLSDMVDVLKKMDHSNLDKDNLSSSGDI